jgi:hypothetical protein
MAEHCTNNSVDRDVGAKWERHFCVWAQHYGKAFTAHQEALKIKSAAWHVQGASRPLPDVTLWTAPVEHHEIKHKEPTRNGCFGLEKYRFESLVAFAEESQELVRYTIHDHSRCGGRSSDANLLQDWFTVNVLDLLDAPHREGLGFSWVSGRKQDVPVWYWSTSLWIPLERAWATGA